jgi:hypothetical protein
VSLTVRFVDRQSRLRWSSFSVLSYLVIQPNGAVVKTYDCYPRGSGFESRTFFWFRRTIKFDTHKPLEGKTDSKETGLELRLMRPTTT